MDLFNSEKVSFMSSASSFYAGISEAALNDIITGVARVQDSPKVVVAYVKRFMVANPKLTKTACNCIYKFCDSEVLHLAANQNKQCLKCDQKRERSEKTSEIYKLRIARFGKRYRKTGQHIISDASFATLVKTDGQAIGRTYLTWSESHRCQKTIGDIQWKDDRYGFKLLQSNECINSI
ncbi:MAG: hypothetical protein EZS28_027736 [Streblomastix strix]|uniref:Uncharacterized protein n=1 Tax=Streblomastix strix TaxID=222440 RepID=A0A5J4V299_9EUKA|nr:MAG: hypothetical protein EZS28_027736 [Streblomastix strix]